MTEIQTSETDQLLARVRKLEDEREILDLIYAYSHGLDGKEHEDFLACFSEDGRFAWRPVPDGDWVLDVRGQEQLDRWYRDHERSIPAGTEHHVVTNPRIVANDGTTARTVSWYLIIRNYGGRPGVRSTGRYLDELVRGEDGRWRIRERLALGDMPR